MCILASFLNAADDCHKPVKMQSEKMTEGELLLNNTEFMNLMKEVEGYLEASKDCLFAENPARMADIQEAVSIASSLFSDAQLSFSDDPLYLGSMALRIDFYDMIVSGKDEIERFNKLISKADNFEIGAIGNEKTRMSIMFNGVLIKKR